MKVKRKISDFIDIQKNVENVGKAERFYIS